MKDAPTTKKKLTPKRRKFAKAYARTGNASASAKEAGYAETSAHDTGHKLLKNPEVIEAVESWEDYLEGQIRPSLQTLENLRDNDESSSIKLKSAETLLKMAGVGQKTNAPTSLNIFMSMTDEELALKMAQLSESVQEKLPKPSDI